MISPSEFIHIGEDGRDKRIPPKLLVPDFPLYIQKWMGVSSKTPWYLSCFTAKASKLCLRCKFQEDWSFKCRPHSNPEECGLVWEECIWAFAWKMSFPSRPHVASLQLIYDPLSSEVALVCHNRLPLCCASCGYVNKLSMFNSQDSTVTRCRTYLINMQGLYTSNMNKCTNGNWLIQEK